MSETEKDEGEQPIVVDFPSGSGILELGEEERKLRFEAFVEIGRGDLLGLLDDLTLELGDDKAALRYGQAAMAYVTDYAMQEVVTGPFRRPNTIIPTRTAPPRRLFSGLFAKHGLFYTVTHPANNQLGHHLAEEIHLSLRRRVSFEEMERCYAVATRLTESFVATLPSDELSDETRQMAGEMTRTFRTVRRHLASADAGQRVMEFADTPATGPASEAIGRLFVERFSATYAALL